MIQAELMNGATVEANSSEKITNRCKRDVVEGTVEVLVT